MPRKRDIDKAVAEYAELEVAVAELVDGRASHVCSACRKKCCRGDVCQQAVECWFLRRVSEHAHGKWWPDDWEDREDAFALTESGCVLKAGRPLICRSFVCDDYVAGYGDLWEAVQMCFASDLLWQAGRITGNTTVENLEESNAGKYAARLRENLADAREQLDLARRLTDPAVSELDKHRITLKLLCLAPKCFRATTRRAILDRLG